MGGEEREGGQEEGIEVCCVRVFTSHKECGHYELHSHYMHVPHVYYTVHAYHMRVLHLCAACAYYIHVLHAPHVCTTYMYYKRK